VSKEFTKYGQIGLGCMGLSGNYGPGLKDDVFIDFIKQTLELGVRFFDTADVYDRSLPNTNLSTGHNERMLGKAIKEAAINREDICLATKCGFLPGWSLDFSPNHIRQACMASLRNLDLDYIDLYYLHRVPKKLEEFKECLETLADLFKEGKIRYIGLSEAKSEYIKYAYNYFEDKVNKESHSFPYNLLAAIETEFSIFTPGPLQKNNTIDICAELDLIFSPYASLSRGLLTESINKDTIFDKLKGDVRREILERFQEPNFSKNLNMRDQLIVIARSLGCTLETLALAWSLKKTNERGCYSILIPGTSKIERVIQNMKAPEIADRLTPDILKNIDEIVPNGAYGRRYPEEVYEAHNISNF
jgi:aryl-alcohol dehydrogenase-like predicted oxidoreductase